MTRRSFVCLSSARAAAILTIGVAALVIALPAPAKAYLYWANGDGVVRADLNGRGVNSNFMQNVTGDGYLGIALSSQYIYFSGSDGVIGRAELNGGDFNSDFISLLPTDVGPAFGPKIGTSLALGGGYIYWPVPGKDDIARCTGDGGEIEARFIRTQPLISEVAVDAGHVYWASGGDEIGRANLDGTDVEPRLMQLETGVGRPVQLVVTGGHIYWSASSGHSIGRANLQGGDAEPDFIVDTRGIVSNPAVGGGYIYWRTEEQLPGSSRMWIGRADINGSDVKRHFMNVTGKITGELVADSLGPGGGHPPHHGKPRR